MLNCALQLIDDPRVPWVVAQVGAVVGGAMRAAATLRMAGRGLGLPLYPSRRYISGQMAIHLCDQCSPALQTRFLWANLIICLCQQVEIFH